MSRLASRILQPSGVAVWLDDADSPWHAAHATEPAVVLAAHDLAYLIYTSGSTGQPKGVRVTHGNLARLFEQTDPWFDFDHQDVWTLFHSCAFDFSVWEMWGALVDGARLVLVPRDTRRAPGEWSVEK